jgi:hypothetical protein
MTLGLTSTNSNSKEHNVEKRTAAHCTGDGWFFNIEGRKSGPFRLTLTSGQVNNQDLESLASKLAVSASMIGKFALPNELGLSALS